jgi:hypothetical protein
MLYNISLPVLISTVLNIMDAVRTVKVCIFTPCLSFVGWLYPYIDRFLDICTVSEVDLNLQENCCCLRVLRTRDSIRKHHSHFIEKHPISYFSPSLGYSNDIFAANYLKNYINFSFLQCLLYSLHITCHNNDLQL